MKTLSYIKDLLLQYKTETERAEVSNKKKQKAIRTQFLTQLTDLQNRFPYLLYPLCPKGMSYPEAVSYMDNLREKVENNYIPIIPTLCGFTDVIGKEVLQTPGFTTLNEPVVFVEDLQNLHEVLLRILLSLPIKKVQITFVDLQCQFNMDAFCQQINPLLYNFRPITEEEELEQLIKRLKERKFEVKQKYGDYRTYCTQNKEIPIPYEFVVLFSDSLQENVCFKKKWSK